MDNGSKNILSVFQSPIFWGIILILGFLTAGPIILFIQSYDWPHKREEITEKEVVKITVPDDPIFSSGFLDTGRKWPPKEPKWSQELKENPLVKLREAYCSRVGYEYADFAGDCFGYQYFHLFNTFTDKEEKFTIYYSTHWQEDAGPLNYGFTRNPEISLRRREASCAIMYGVIQEEELLATNNASTTKRSFGLESFGSIYSKDGLTEIIVPFDRELTDEEMASGYTDKKIIAVPRFPYADSEYGFLLTSGDTQPILEACAQEFDMALNSRSINYPSVKLSSESSGILYLQNTASGFESAANIKKPNVLFFENFDTGREEMIASESFSEARDIADPFLSGDTLYYLEGSLFNPVIKAVDIFSGESQAIPLQYSKEKPVHSFFARDDKLYYLTGEFCNEYMAKCKDMTLWVYNLKSSVNEILATGLTSRDIEGFNSAGDQLILRWNDGDAGCFWGHYESFNLSSRTVNNLGSYAHCEGDADESYLRLQNLSAGVAEFDHLIIQDGKIFSPLKKGVYIPRRINIRVDTQEYPLLK